ncbi:MAG: PEP-CTERM sorting domain-containing protein [bacterium]
MQRMLLLSLVLLLHTSFAHADPIPIRITGGSLDLALEPPESFGILDIVGRGDFRLNEFVVSETVGGALCRPCPPGDLLDLGGGFADEFGSATLNGVTYTLVPAGEAGVANHFFAQGVVPAVGTTGVLLVPFTYVGFFEIPGRQFREYDLLGHGMATVRFRPDNFTPTPTWDFDGARFEFAPTPEPATLLLISSGLGVLAWLRSAGRRCGPS